MNVSVKVQGDAAVMEKLRSIEEKSRNIVLLRMGNAAGSVVRTAARALAPRDTGALHSSLEIKILTPTAQHPNVRVLIGPSRAYAKWLTAKKTKRRGKVGLKTHTEATKLYKKLVPALEYLHRREANSKKAPKVLDIAKAIDPSQFAKFKGDRRLSPYLFARRLVRANFPGVRVRVPVRYAHIVAKRPGPGYRFLQRAAEISQELASRAAMQQAVLALAKV